LSTRHAPPLQASLTLGCSEAVLPKESGFDANLVEAKPATMHHHPESLWLVTKRRKVGSEPRGRRSSTPRMKAIARSTHP
jgi:hypothetical protein